MKIQCNAKGELSLSFRGKQLFSSSPVGVLIHKGIAYLPEKAEVTGEHVKVQYPCGECECSFEKKNGYYKMTLLSAPEDADGFLFGPYQAPAVSCGEVLGAAWQEDGSVVCVQSLVPKVVEGSDFRLAEDRTGLDLQPSGFAAVQKDNVARIQFFVRDRSREWIGTNEYEVKNPTGENVTIDIVVKPEEGPDAKMEGAAVAFLCAENADKLLDIIEEMELAEGLPHPTYLGKYAKRDIRVSSYYLIFSGDEMTNQERIDAAKRAGVSCVYFSDVLEKWGHFSLNHKSFPGGFEEISSYAEDAYKDGILIGAHSLSNFTHTNDEYVTPVPHDRLLVMDTTTLAQDLSETDTTVCLTKNTNYEKLSALNVFRIDKELITYESFDNENCRLLGCTRGAFGTVASAHKAGDVVDRLVDHGYKVVFPDIVLQDEMADCLGHLLKKAGIRRMSFDGLEGCAFTGHGTYARNKYVKRVYDIVGDELLCDASNTGNYLWHAFSYSNWGEPWYDDARRGGMFGLRTRHQGFYHRNLIPAMTGWYVICANDGRWEATPPENMEFILSRAAAFDAGQALSVASSVVKKHGFFDQYMDMVKLWNDFRLHGDIPELLRKQMQDERSNWHLEKAEDGWKLYEMVVRTTDMMYCDRQVGTEAGAVGIDRVESEIPNRVNRAPVIIWDHPFPEAEEYEPINFRIRVGEPGCGYMENLTIYDQLHFDFKAEGGDYLDYRGGMELYHYDCNFNLKEVVPAYGVPFEKEYSQRYVWGMFRFTTDDDPHARYLLTENRIRKIHHISPKKEL